MTAQQSARQAGVLADIEGKLFADVPETAAVLRIDERTVRRSIAAGEIPGIRAGQRWRIPTSWLRKVAGLEAQPGEQVPA